MFSLILINNNLLWYKLIQLTAQKFQSSSSTYIKVICYHLGYQNAEFKIPEKWPSLAQDILFTMNCSFNCSSLNCCDFQVLQSHSTVYYGFSTLKINCINESQKKSIKYKKK